METRTTQSLSCLYSPVRGLHFFSFHLIYLPCLIRHSVDSPLVVLSSSLPVSDSNRLHGTLNFHFAIASLFQVNLQDIKRKAQLWAWLLVGSSVSCESVVVYDGRSAASASWRIRKIVNASWRMRQHPSPTHFPSSNFPSLSHMAPRYEMNFSARILLAATLGLSQFKQG